MTQISAPVKNTSTLLDVVATLPENAKPSMDEALSYSNVRLRSAIARQLDGESVTSETVMLVAAVLGAFRAVGLKPPTIAQVLDAPDTALLTVFRDDEAVIDEENAAEHEGAAGADFQE